MRWASSRSIFATCAVSEMAISSNRYLWLVVQLYCIPGVPSETRASCICPEAPEPGIELQEGAERHGITRLFDGRYAVLPIAASLPCEDVKRSRPGDQIEALPSRTGFAPPKADLDGRCKRQSEHDSKMRLVTMPTNSR